MWEATYEDDRPLVAFEERAEAAGALGFYRDDKTSTLVILVPSTRSDRFDLAELGQAPVPVAVKVSEVDSDAIEAARELLTAMPTKAFVAGESMGFYFNPRLEKITITTSVDAQDLQEYLGELWQLIDYHHGEVATAGRFNDVAPFWGGAAFDVPFGEPDWDCTTGFTLKNAAGTKGMLTAAHCALAGEVATTPNGAIVGTADPANRRCGAAPVGTNSDLQLLTGKSYDNKIYVGGMYGTVAEVIEAGDPAVGSTYKFSGAVSFEKTGQQVLSLNGQWWAAAGASWCGTTFWVLNQVVFTRAGVCDVQSGDSGGPFYATQASNPVIDVRIRGMVVAKTGGECYAMKYSKIHTLLGWSIYTI
jgi:hypothetical protein